MLTQVKGSGESGKGTDTVRLRKARVQLSESKEQEQETGKRGAGKRKTRILISWYMIHIAKLNFNKRKTSSVISLMHECKQNILLLQFLFRTQFSFPLSLFCTEAKKKITEREIIICMVNSLICLNNVQFCFFGYNYPVSMFVFLRMYLSNFYIHDLSSRNSF